MSQHVLVVDDDPIVTEVVEKYLERSGYRVSVAHDGRIALSSVQSATPDLVVLDLMVPGMDGMTVCRRIREHSAVPVIMLTARGEDRDKLLGFGAGADDYVVKPFSPAELVARVQAVLRRSAAGSSPATDSLLTLDSLTVDTARRTVQRDGQPVDLTRKEFDLLAFLIRHPGQVFTRDQLLEHVWSYDYFGDASTVTVHVRRLREKIEPDPESPVYLRTVWGVGYRLVSAASD